MRTAPPTHNSTAVAKSYNCIVSVFSLSEIRDRAEDQVHAHRLHLLRLRTPTPQVRSDQRTANTSATTAQEWKRDRKNEGDVCGWLAKRSALDPKVCS